MQICCSKAARVGAPILPITVQNFLIHEHKVFYILMMDEYQD